jgi:rod shape-determining protein MreD
VLSIALSLSRSRVPSSPKRRFASYSGPQWHVVALVLAIALVAQTTLLHSVALRGATPSLVLVAVVWFAIRVDVRRAAIYGLIAGLCEDVLAAGTGGAWTVSTTITAMLTSVLQRGFFADSIPIVAVVTGIATLVRALLFWTVMSLEGYPAGLAGTHFHQALWQALLNVAVMIAAMLIVRRFEAPVSR